MGREKGPLAICDTCGMSGLADYLDEEEICRKCKKITALEKTIEEQGKKLAEVEQILQKVLEGRPQKEPEPVKSYADKVKEQLPERSKTIVVKQPDTTKREGPQQRRKQILVYVGEAEADSKDCRKPTVALVGDSNARNVGKKFSLTD